MSCRDRPASPSGGGGQREVPDGMFALTSAPVEAPREPEPGLGSDAGDPVQDRG